MVRATQSTLLTSQNCCGAPSSHPRCKTTVHRSLPELRRKAMQTYQPRELLFLSLSWLAPGLLPCVCKQMQSLALSWETRSFGFPPTLTRKAPPPRNHYQGDGSHQPVSGGKCGKPSPEPLKKLLWGILTADLKLLKGS